MSKIVISGYYGFANAGDEAMLTAIVKSLRSRDVSAELTVISGNPAATAARHNVVSIHRFNPLAIINAVRESDLLLSGGGSLLQDVTSRKSLLYYLSVLALGRWFGKKVMLFAQGIGPINSAFLRRLTRFVCSNADLITVRDADSLEELRRIGIPEQKVLLTADAVLTLPQADIRQGRLLLQSFDIPDNQRLIAVSVRKWQEEEKYLQELAAAADVLIEKYDAHVVLLPLQYPVDVDACRKMYQYVKKTDRCTVLDAACDTEMFLSLTGNFSLLIGMRLHALIFAAVMRIPFVGVSYDPKIDGFIKEVGGVSAGQINGLTAQEVVAAAAKALNSDAGSWRRLEVLCNKAMENISMAFSLLPDSQKHLKGE